MAENEAGPKGIRQRLACQRQLLIDQADRILTTDVPAIDNAILEIGQDTELEERIDKLLNIVGHAMKLGDW